MLLIRIDTDQDPDWRIIYLAIINNVLFYLVCQVIANFCYLTVFEITTKNIYICIIGSLAIGQTIGRQMVSFGLFKNLYIHKLDLALRLNHEKFWRFCQIIKPPGIPKWCPDRAQRSEFRVHIVMTLAYDQMKSTFK